jgi:hypothetical protein
MGDLARASSVEGVRGVARLGSSPLWMRGVARLDSSPLCRRGVARMSSSPLCGRVVARPDSSPLCVRGVARLDLSLCGRGVASPAPSPLEGREIDDSSSRVGAHPLATSWPGGGGVACTAYNISALVAVYKIAKFFFSIAETVRTFDKLRFRFRFRI